MTDPATHEPLTRPADSILVAMAHVSDAISAAHGFHQLVFDLASINKRLADVYGSVRATPELNGTESAENAAVAEPFVVSNPHNGFRLDAYYLSGDDIDCRVVLTLEGEKVREFTYPKYAIWTLLAHWTEWPEVNPDKGDEESTEARALADGVGASLDALAEGGAE